MKHNYDTLKKYLLSLNKDLEIRENKPTSTGFCLSTNVGLFNYESKENLLRIHFKNKSTFTVNFPMTKAEENVISVTINRLK